MTIERIWTCLRCWTAPLPHSVMGSTLKKLFTELRSKYPQILYKYDEEKFLTYTGNILLCIYILLTLPLLCIYLINIIISIYMYINNTISVYLCLTNIIISIYIYIYILLAFLVYLYSGCWLAKWVRVLTQWCAD